MTSVKDWVANVFSPRLMNARGNNLLMEEKERNKVYKTLPRLEAELHELISNWEAAQGREFLVGGTNFAAFIAHQVSLVMSVNRAGNCYYFSHLQKEEHKQALESEKLAREKAKKENLLNETRFGAKPSTPAKLKGRLELHHIGCIVSLCAGLNNTKTRKMPSPSKSMSNLTRSNSSRLVQKVVSLTHSCISFLMLRFCFSRARWQPCGPRELDGSLPAGRE